MSASLATDTSGADKPNGERLNIDVIDDLVKQSTQDQVESRPFMEPKSGAKKRGRPRKNAEPTESAEAGQAPGAAPDPALDFVEPCKALFGVGSGLIVRFTGVAGTALLPEEIQALGTTWGSVCNKYLPQTLHEHAQLIAALTVTAGVSYRIKTEVEKEIARKMAQMKAEREAMDAAVRANEPHLGQAV